ncbi:hypothetical protein WS63_28370 [Burkholderia stagnalis]|uniref:5-aminolevulinate synthase n=2 Tax=Burkholderia stagnalis TaxID=1503054 RepID=A0A108IRZ2_9BURK|nr:hypothetical protein WT74_19715 [Burkholderia stagnalis]KVC59217.1 hypothetical protein WS59_21450 [Burkholderia stagnalis]KVD83286.1 hypothetical protein WS63_28370 [Burkholderia stagnalis]KVL87979.1 hypothetical protein WT02_27910 [Burkholderia stagnalis]KVM07519.1 hypothetical protein WT04_21270 [Burkholderia stagnalis]
MMSTVEVKFKYSEAFGEVLHQLKATDAYRHFLTFSRSAGNFPLANHQGKAIEVWCSNDYLGMGQHEKVIASFRQALEQFGAGSGGSRNISGNTGAHVDLERYLARLYGRDSALIFNNGYLANTESLGALVSVLNDVVVYSDAFNHRSMIEGIRKLKGDKYIFRHNDLADLERGLAAEPFERPKLIIFESVYSMDGDLAPVKEIVELAKQYNALTYIDETHSFGVFGPNGLGLCEALDEHRVDFIQGGFGKAVGTSGGFIVGDRDAVDCIRSLSPGFIFTTSLPPALMAATQTSIDHIVGDTARRKTLFRNVAYLKSRLRQHGIDFVDAESHIVPIIIPGLERIKRVAQTLLADHRIYVQPINFPSVPRGQERFRVTVTPDHSTAQIDRFAAALQSTI